MLTPDFVNSADTAEQSDYLSAASGEEDGHLDDYPQNSVNSFPEQIRFSKMQMQTPSPPPNGDSKNNGHKLHNTHSQNVQQQGPHKLTRVKSLDTCRVCGDGPARMHYGVPTCFGCKGFFRRTLKRTKEYTCRYSDERNSCRFCRFKRCLEVGMDPKAVRPDRDAAGRSHPIRHRRSRTSLGELTGEDYIIEGNDAEPTDDWIRKLPVDMRTLLMQIMNIELLVAKGDSTEDAKYLYPLPFTTLNQILEDPSLLDGKRTEMRYECYRQVHANEFVAIAHRRLIAIIDMVDHLCTLMDLHNLEDKVALVKASYAPLTIFCCVAATAQATKNRDKLCLCSFGFVLRGIHRTGEEPYHFANRLVDRILDELVEPFRAFNFKEQEVVLMKAIVTLNPHIRTLSTEAAEQIADLRDRIQETLYNVVRESHPKEVASSRFGNLLLFLPNVMMLGNVMYENLQFMQSFGKQHIDPLLGELLDNIEPMEQSVDFIDDMLSDNSDGFIHHSMSASSISSMNSSNCGYEPNALASSSATNLAGVISQNDSYFNNSRRASSTGDQLCNTSITHNNLETTSERDLQRHEQQQLSSAESDPDYNITLTAENLSGMRQAIVHSMEIDSSTAVPNMTSDSTMTSDYFSDSSQNQRPNFYLEPTNSVSNGCLAGMGPNQQQCCGTSGHLQNTYSFCSLATSGSHTTIGTRHIFTVEPTKTVYNNNNANQKMQYTIPTTNPCVFQGQSKSSQISSLQSQSLQHEMTTHHSMPNPNHSCCCKQDGGIQQQHLRYNAGYSTSANKNFLMDDDRTDNKMNMLESSAKNLLCSSNSLLEVEQDCDMLSTHQMIHKGSVGKLTSCFEDNSQSSTMQKSQSYPYVIQAVVANQQQSFFNPLQEQQAVHFQMSNNSSSQNIYIENLEEQQELFPSFNHQQQVQQPQQ